MLLCEYDVLEHYKQVHPPESAGELRPGSAGDALPLWASVCTACGNIEVSPLITTKKRKKEKARDFV